MSVLLLAIKLIAGFVAVVLLLMAADEHFRPRLKGWLGEMAVKVNLRTKGWVACHDFLLPLGRTTTQIDHLACLPQGLLVIETKNYRGRFKIQDGQWFRWMMGGWRPMHSPVAQNAAHVAAVRQAADAANIGIEGRVIVSDNARFDGSVPKEVVRLAELSGSVAHLTQGEPDERIGVIFASVCRKADRSGRGKRAHVRNLKRKLGAPKVGGGVTRMLGWAGLLTGIAISPLPW